MWKCEPSWAGRASRERSRVPSPPNSCNHDSPSSRIECPTTTRLPHFVHFLMMLSPHYVFTYLAGWHNLNGMGVTLHYPVRFFRHWQTNNGWIIRLVLLSTCAGVVFVKCIHFFTSVVITLNLFLGSQRVQEEGRVVEVNMGKVWIQNLFLVLITTQPTRRLKISQQWNKKGGLYRRVGGVVEYVHNGKRVVGKRRERERRNR